MKRIYLDHNATTPLDPRVFEKMKPYFAEEFGNPSSESHAWGWSAQKAVQDARRNVADLLGAQAHEIVFTAGSTEATNMAIVGLALELKLNQGRDQLHMITTDVEHACVLESFKLVQKLGVKVDILPTNSYGQLELPTLQSALKPETVLVSAIWVNNEIGSVNPIIQIGQLCRERGILFHTDATQAVGKFKIDLSLMAIDLLSFSAHKIYGPKGIGALYVRSQKPHVTLQPLMVGGGQEKGRRSGTLNVPAIVGLGECARLLAAEALTDNRRIQELRNHLYEGLMEIFPDMILNGHPEERSPSNLNITLPSFPLDLALPHLIGIAMSRGSACHSGIAERSHVLSRLGVSQDHAERTLRLGLGKWTTTEEITETLAIFRRAKDKANSSIPG